MQSYYRNMESEVDFWDFVDPRPLCYEFRRRGRRYLVKKWWFFFTSLGVKMKLSTSTVSVDFRFAASCGELWAALMCCDCQWIVNCEVTA